MLYGHILQKYILVLINALARTIKSFVTYFFKFQAVSVHDCKNFRTFTDEEVITRSILYINTV